MPKRTVAGIENEIRKLSDHYGRMQTSEEALLARFREAVLKRERLGQRIGRLFNQLTKTKG